MLERRTKSDDQLRVERLARGDDSAMVEILADHAGTVHRISRSVLADAEVAEEVTQDVFLELWKRPDRFEPTRGSLRSYLVGVARNKAIDRLRSYYARQRMTEAVLRDSHMSATQLGGSEDEVAQREVLFAGIRQLPQVQREALVLAYYGGRTYRQVAEELGVPEGTVKTRLRQALIGLRRTLNAELPGLSDAYSAG